MFALCGGYYSTPLSGCGSSNVQFDPTGNWRQQLGYFFADIYNSGIRNITPTLVLWGFGGDVGVAFNVRNFDTCGYGLNDSVVNFWPALPFAMESSNPSFGYGWMKSGAYSCASFNTVNFVGYPNLYAVLNGMLHVAATTPSSSSHLNVEELDVNNETRFDYATVFARLVFDNKDTSVPLPGRDVLSEMRYYMTQNGFPWTNLTFSLLPDAYSSLSGYDCGSLYGDSARLLSSSAFVSTLGGGEFGWPSPTLTNNLPCGGSASSLYGPLPMSYAQPTVLDHHHGPCLTIPNEGNNCVPSQSQNTAAEESQSVFSDTATFLNSFCSKGWRHNSTQMCGALYMLGEVSVYQPQPVNSSLNCDGSLTEIPAAAVQGFNASTLAGRNLSGAPGVVFRPWVDPTGQHAPNTTQTCYGFPQVLQPTFVPNP